MVGCADIYLQRVLVLTSWACVSATYSYNLGELMKTEICDNGSVNEMIVWWKQWEWIEIIRPLKAYAISTCCHLRLPTQFRSTVQLIKSCSTKLQSRELLNIREYGIRLDPKMKCNKNSSVLKNSYYKMNYEYAVTINYYINRRRQKGDNNHFMIIHYVIKNIIN